MNHKSSIAGSAGMTGDQAPGGARWFWPGAMCAGLLAAIAIFQALVPISPDPYWDSDPRVQMMSVPGKNGVAPEITDITPSLYIAMNVAAVVIAFAGLVAHRMGGGRLSGWVLSAAAAGSLAGLYGSGGNEDAVKVLGWVAAAFGGAAVWHLGQRPRERALVAGALAGICVLLAMKTAMYMLVDFPSVQASIRQNMDQILQSRGWTAESAQAQAYLRRSSQLEATGAYGLSNVFGSIMGALAFAGLGLALGVHKAAGGARAWLVWLAGLCAAVCLFLSFSKGAAVATAGVGAFGLATWGVMKWWPARPKWVVPVGAAVLLAGGFGAVVFRGAVIGPPATIQGERSLLFRYQYWVGSARMAQEMSGEQWVTGLSPQGFRGMYPRVKEPLNPEEVSSSHNYWIDYSLMLGVGGVAWAVLLTGWGMRGVYRAQMEGGEKQGADAVMDRSGLRLGGGLALAVFVPVYALQKPMMLPETLVILFAGFGAMAFVIGIVTTPGWVDRKCVGWGLALGGLVVLLQGQIEMTFVTAGSVAMGWMLVALGGSGGSEGLDEKKNPGVGTWIGAVAAISVVLGTGVWMGTRGAALLNQQRLLEKSAQAMRTDFGQGAELLAKAVEAYPNSPRVARNAVDLGTEAVAFMSQAGARYGSDYRERLMGWVEYSQKVLATLPPSSRNTTTVLLSEARLRFVQGRALGDQAVLAQARKLMEQVVALSPYDRTMREELARVCQAQGDNAGELAAWEMCLKLSEQGYLDETRVYTEEQRAQVEETIRRLRGR